LTLAGAKSVASGIDAAERAPRIRRAPWLAPVGRDTRVLYLSWTRPGGSWRVTLPAGLPPDWRDARSSLVFNLVHLGRRDASDPDGRGRPIDFTLELTDGDGRRARLPLSWFSMLAPPFATRPFKTDLMPWQNVASRSFVFPLSAFHQANPDFHPERLASIAFIFDHTAAGDIGVDDVALRPDGAFTSLPH
jgi:hypothetical protein